MKNKGLIIIIIILIICVLGLSSCIIYEKVLTTDKSDMVNKNDKIIETPQEFINTISKVENELESKSEHTVDYKDFSVTIIKNEYNYIENITIKYKDKQINKDLSMYGGLYGLQKLKAFYFDEEIGLFILTLLTAPTASEQKTYIIAFDTNGNIHLDEQVGYSIYILTVDNSDKLVYLYLMDGRIDCYGMTSVISDNEIIKSTIIYDYIDNKITEIERLETTYKDLPKCEQNIETKPMDFFSTFKFY